MTGGPSPTRGALRVLRGGLLSLTSAALAVAAHTAAGGCAPASALTVLLTLVLAGIGTALANRRRSPLAITTALGASQLGLHLLLNTSHAPFESHGHSGSAAPVTTGLGGSWLMTGTHILAVLLTALVLARAESAVFAVAAALGMLLPRKLPPLPPAQAPLRISAVSFPPVGRLLEVLLNRVCTRRGPPVLS